MYTAECFKRGQAVIYGMKDRSNGIIRVNSQNLQ